MPQHEVELILTRQLASYLTVPVYLVDAEGDVVYYNEAAEPVLGMRFQDTGTLRREAWTEAIRPEEETGEPIEPDDLPTSVALEEGRPVHRRLVITSVRGRRCVIEAAAFPLIGQADRALGGMCMFWEAKQQ